MKIFFDGGWRPATGMETAVVVRGQDHVRQGLGPGSAMEAEWLALIQAVELARQLGLAQPVFLGDSLAVIGQASGMAPCRGACAQHFESLAGLEPPSGAVRFRHVKRSQNLAGIALARLHVR
ncbi:MAG TPA: reverse transcriptase-like protein [Sphingomonas sp.]